MKKPSCHLWIRRSHALCLLYVVLTSQAELSAVTEREYEKLWLVDTHYMTPAQRDEWKKQARETEGLQTYLVDKINSAWAARDPDLLRLLFKPLQYRLDLSPDELAALAKPVEEMLEQGLDSNQDDRASVTYASGVLRTLGNYPSARHEELAIALTESADGGVYVNAALALAKIGGPKSLDALRRLVERVKPPPGKTDIYIGEVLTAMHDLERRLSRADPVKVDASSTPEAGPLKTEPSASVSKPSDTSRFVEENGKSSGAAWLWGISAFVLASLMLVLFRSRK